ncbi:MAG: AAA family ATPase [Rhodospirillaceae bacterium]|nr:AAA family ATPase [Rhodospirillaceae bacterium]
MTFNNVLAQVTWLLLCERFVTYRRIAREFDLDHAALEDVRFELIQIKRCAIDRGGEFLVWAGTTEDVVSISAVTAAATSAPLMPLRDAVLAARRIAPAQSPALAPSSDAERRPLTVMFCDLADSTALSTRLDPEDLQDVIQAYQETATRIIQDYEGYVAKYMGDGILIYFGYPKSLERNAERAVRSALGIVEAMAQLNRTLGREKGIEIAVRIGIATGMVMVGTVIGEGMAQERAVIGEAPNVAARLQGLAGRNGVVIGALTRDLSGDGFVYQDLGSHALKGITGLVKCWSVTGLRADVTDERYVDETDGAAQVPSLVGRDEETGLLRRAWQSTREEGRGQVVVISGEAGIGKSVLVDGLKAELHAAGLMRMTLRCSVYHTGSALYPVIEHMKRLAGWQPEDGAVARLAKLEAVLARYDQPSEETIPLMAALMSLPLPADRYPPLALSPQQQKRQTQDALIAIILETAEREPLLAIWEDLHWADPSTLELLELLIEQVPTASLLMVLTARPEFTPAWPARSHITPITLNRLERPHVEALVARIAGAKPLPVEVVDHIVIKTDGVPLYVEELTKTILASEILRDAGDRFELTGPLSSLAIPDTLQESLMARLDRLPQVRELAQLAAVLGREFAYEMISGLSTIGDVVLQQGLGQLVDAELLYQRGRPPRARYIFKHALVQDAAYGSLLKRNRQQAHLQVAELLEARFPDTVGEHPEILGHHYRESNLTERAVKYFLAAGERDLRMSANAEAIAHLSKGLEIIAAIPAGRGRDALELDLLMTMGPALIATKGYAASEVEPAYRRALELCVALGDWSKQFSVLLGLSLIHLVRSDLLSSRDLAEQAVELARLHPEPGFDLAADRALGLALIMLGELDAARSTLRRVYTSYDLATHGSFAFRRGGSDFGVGALGMGSLAAFPLGYPDQARELCAQGLVLARKLGHPISEALVRWNGAMVEQARGDVEATLVHVSAGLELAEEKGFPQYVAWLTVLRGAALLQQGDTDAAIAELRKGIDHNHAIGSLLQVPYWTTFLATAYGRNGQATEGLIAVEEALERVERTKDRFAEAELYRVKGDLMLCGDDPDDAGAESCFQQAIEIARGQNARCWELRAATDLARLWLRQGKKAAARDLLSEIHGWFTEGFATTDLMAAQELLDRMDVSQRAVS